jgi:peptide/nickel transport system substrate-binding protein
MAESRPDTSALQAPAGPFGSLYRAGLPRRDFLRRSGLLLAATGIASPVLAACGSSPSSPGKSTQSKVTSAILDTFGTLDPPVAGSLGSLDVNHQVFECLIQYSNPSLSTLVPWMIQSMPTQTSPDTYEATLLPGLMFQNGTPVTPNDIAYTYELLLDPATGSYYTEFLTLLEKVVVQGDKIIFKLSHDYGSFLADLAMMMILPEKAHSSQGSTKFGEHPIGSGPFAFSPTSNETTVNLTRYRAYRGKARPQVDAVTFETVLQASTREAELIGGQFTIMEGVPAADMTSMAARSGITTGAGFGGVMMALETDQIHPPMDNLLLRQALMYAIDRETIINTVFAGKYARVTNSPLPPGNPYYVNPTPSYPFDLAKARSLVAQAGYPKGVSFQLLVPTVSWIQTAAPLVQEMWARAGLHATIRLIEQDAGYSILFAHKKYDTFLVWGVNQAYGNDPDIFFRLSNYGVNRTSTYGINTAPYLYYDKLVDEGRLATTFAARKAIYTQAVDVWSEEVSNFFCFINVANLFAWDSNLKGFIPPGNDVQDLTVVHFA